MPRTMAMPADTAAIEMLQRISERCRQLGFKGIGRLRRQELSIHQHLARGSGNLQPIRLDFVIVQMAVIRLQFPINRDHVMPVPQVEMVRERILGDRRAPRRGLGKLAGRDDRFAAHGPRQCDVGEKWMILEDFTRELLQQSLDFDPLDQRRYLSLPGS